MRFVAIDFGSKRIGVAVGVDDPPIASAKPSIEPTGTLAKDAVRISELVKQHDAGAVVLGVPVNPDDPRMANVCRKLAECIRAHGIVVHEVDESMTSVQAENTLLGEDLTAAGRRKLRDGEAARLILERYFEQTNA